MNLNLNHISKNCKHDLKYISLDDMYGNLKIVTPRYVHHGSKEKVTWACKCGRNKDISVCSVMNGASKSCGRCNELSFDEVSKYLGSINSKLTM